MNQNSTDRHAALLSLLSGACALVYQLVIIRRIRLYAGGTVLAISIALSGYLLGIAIGSWLVGRIADRLGGRWRTYAILELGIALTIILWVLMDPAWSYLASHLGTPLLMLCLVVSLLPPTILMGGTLPVLSRCLVPSGEKIRRLYTCNVLGAAAGCMLASWWLIPGPGIGATILIAACINLFIAASSWRLSIRGTSWRPVQTHISPRGEKISIRLGHLFAAGISGAGFFSAEIAWTRLLVNVASSSTLVVGTVIGGSLLGIAAGSWLISLDCFRKRPDGLIGWFFICGGLVLVGSPFALELATRYLAHHVNSFSGQIPAVAIVVALCGLGLLVTIFSALLSLIFPLILRSATYQAALVGTLVGRLLAANTVGAIIAITATSLYGIPALGATGCLFAGALCYVVLAIPFSPQRTGKGVALLCLLAIVLVSTGAGTTRTWIHAGITRFREVSEEDILFRHEGRESTTSAIRIDSQLALTVNGLLVAETSRPDMWDLLLKAHLPLLIHSDPDRVAVVGLGAGISLGAVTSHRSVTRIDCIEISPGVIAAQDVFSSWNDDPSSDPRVAIHQADGRRFLASRPGQYDVITVDPVDPPVCDLYTVEFYRCARKALRPGGLMVQWVPLFRLGRDHFHSLIWTFLDVFPRATLWYDGTSVLLIAHADKSLLIDSDRFLQRAASPDVKASLERIGSPSPAMLLGTFICGPGRLGNAFQNSSLNSDDRPSLEYRAILSGHRGRLSQASNLETVLSLAEPLAAIGGNDAGIGPRSPAVLRTILLELSTVRISRLRGEHRRAEEILQQLTGSAKLRPADVQQLAPFHAGP